ncbi:MAG: hypothetical protein ABIL58_13970 [Pseudomonadota bacterium]
MENIKTQTARAFCFMKSEDRLVPCNLEIPAERVFEGLGTGEAIMEKIDQGPVDIVSDGKVVGRVTGYRIVRRKLKLVEEYFGGGSQE